MHDVTIIGCGSIGERHLRCFQKSGRARVRACDSNPELLRVVAERYGVQPVADYRAALNGTGDIIVICTPAHLHVQMAMDSLEAGRHVLVEKPLAHSAAGVPELLALYARSARQAAVAYVYHQMPVLNEAAAHLATGGLGLVHQTTVVSGQPFHLLRPAYAQTYYRDRMTGGGAIQDALTHMANWIESVLGPTSTVLCDCAHQAIPEVTVEDTVHVAARNGRTMVSYSLNQFQGPNETSIQFNAEGGSLRIELHNSRWGTRSFGDPDWAWRTVAPVERDAHFIAQANAFLDAVEGRAAHICSLSSAVATLRFNLSCLESSASGTRVACSDHVRIPPTT